VTDGSNQFQPDGINIFTFYTFAQYRIYSSGSITDKLVIDFDKSERSEAYPVLIRLFDEKSGKKQKEIKPGEWLDLSNPKESRKLTIDVADLSRGPKILHMYYSKAFGKEGGEAEGEPLIERTRIVLVD
jgi:hypothetical protein